MNYWIFKVNPEHYRIDERLLDPAPQLTWAVTRYHERIQKGDTVFIWRAGTPRGICAVLVIETCPYEPEPTDLNDGFELPPGSVKRGLDHWAKGQLTQRFPIIEANIIKKIPGLELFSFFSAFQQAINYSVTRQEGARLLDFIGKYQAENHESTTKPAAKPRKPAPVPAVSAKKNQPAKPANKSANVALLKCEACGRYVVSSDTDRHIREFHGGQPVEWNETK